MTYSPDVLQTIWGYQVDTAGYLLIPRGAFCFIFAPLMIKFGDRINAKIIMVAACLSIAVCTGMFCFINTTPDLVILFISEILIAFSSIAFMSTVYTIAYSKVPKHLTNDAAGVFNFFRTFASSIGTSITATMVTINQQVSWHDLARHINRYSHAFNYIIPHVSSKMTTQTLLIISSWAIEKQANLLAFISVFVVFTGCAILLCIVPLFMEALPRGHKIALGE